MNWNEFDIAEKYVFREVGTEETPAISVALQHPVAGVFKFFLNFGFLLSKCTEEERHNWLRICFWFIFWGLDCERKCVQTHVLLMTQMVFWNTGLVRLDSVWIGEKNYTDVVCINLHLGSLELKELLKSVSVVAPLCKSLLHVLAHFWFSYPLNTRRKTQLVGSFSVRLIK